MKLYLLLILLVFTSCDKKLDKKRLSIMADNFCSCHKGVYYIKFNYLDNDVLVNCNNGTIQHFNQEDIIKRYCE